MKRLLFLTPLLVASLLADAVDVRQEVVDGQAVSTVNDNFRRLDINKMTKSQTSSLVETAISDGISTTDVTATGTITAGWLAAPYPMLIVVDQKTAGTAGGTATSGSWATRTLNTTSTNTITSASLSSNKITLPSGTYYATWSAPAFYVGDHQTRFVSTPTATITLLGQQSHANVSAHAGFSFGSGVFSIDSSTDFELQHRVALTRSGDGYGTEVGWGTEVYSMVQIWKLR